LPALTAPSSTGRNLEKANLEGKPSSFGTVAFQVGGEVFCLPRPLLMVLSPHWAARLGAEPDLSTVDLPGEAASFRAFVDIVSCTDVASSEITAENVLHVLRWSKEFGMTTSWQLVNPSSLLATKRCSHHFNYWKWRLNTTCLCCMPGLWSVRRRAPITWWSQIRLLKSDSSSHQLSPLSICGETLLPHM